MHLVNLLVLTTFVVPTFCGVGHLIPAQITSTSSGFTADTTSSAITNFVASSTSQTPTITSDVSTTSSTGYGLWRNGTHVKIVV
ncbi:hypothetical protein GY45DRAFT_1330656 [Cubamyces sp. BRFM 1775]|nr:hypothetical protein GY45DRAFT_1330656 [Cubamyces sp. BRFM 1775]